MTTPPRSSWDDGSTGRAIAKGTAWVMALRVVLRMLGVVSTLILARLLMPEDFGIIALATVIAGGLEMLGQFNFKVWLIRQQDPARTHYDTVWTLGLVRNLCVSGLIVLLAGTAGQFYDDPRLVSVLYVLAITTAVSGLENIGLVDFQKHMTFDREFTFLCTVKLGAALMTVATAFAWRSYWALLAGVATGTFLRVFLSYRVHHFRPRLCLEDCREIFDYSKWLLTGSLFGFLYTRSRMLIVGKLLDSQALGLFSVSQEVSNIAATEMLVPLRRVLLPAYSKMADDLPGLRRAFLQTFAVILFLGLPVACGVGLVAEPLVRLALGEKWLATVPLIQILVFYGVASICIANQGPLLMALGRTRALSNLYAFGVLLQVPCVVVGTLQFGLAGAACAVAGVHLLLLIISLLVTLRYLEISISQMLASIWRTVAAVTVMVCCVYWLQCTLGPLIPGASLLLVSSVAAGIFFYCLAIYLLWLLNGDESAPEWIASRFIMESLSHRNISMDRLWKRPQSD